MQWRIEKYVPKPERERERSELSFEGTGAISCSLVVLSPPEKWWVGFNLSFFIDATNGDEARQKAIDHLLVCLETMDGQLRNLVSANPSPTRVEV